MSASTTRLVWSSDRGSICAVCGRPVAECRCVEGEQEAVPERIVARLRLETAGRHGKQVTVITGLPRNRELLRDLATELKRACGSGGTATADGVELQGDRRERVRTVLAGKGWVVKG